VLYSKPEVKSRDICRFIAIFRVPYTDVFITALVAMEPIVYEEREFVWDDYLEETKSSAAPATSFKQVSQLSQTNEVCYYPS